MPRLGRFLVAHPWVAYALLAALAFPVLEMLLHGERALQYAHDVFDNDVPRLFSIAADWRAHRPVLWDPHLVSGNGLLSRFALPPLAPDVLLSFVVPPFVAFGANTALMSFAAGLAMHVFLRDSLRLPAVACLVGGILATLAFWHYIYGYAALLLPLVLWTTDRALADDRRPRHLALAVLVVAFLLFSSQVQVVLLDGAVALAWVLCTTSGIRSTAARVAGLAAIWVAAALLAAPILASQVAALPDSQRAIWDLAYLYPPGPMLRAAAELYTGVLVGVPVTANLGGSGDIYGSVFLGAAGLSLLVVGLVTPRRTSREWLLLALPVAIPVIDVLAVLAAPLLENAPLLRTFQIIRVRHLLPVVLIVNAAIGAAWLARPDPVARLGARRRVAGAIGLAAVGAVLAWQGWVALVHVRRPSGSDLVRDGWTFTFAALAVGALAVVAIAVAGYLRARQAGWGRFALTGTLAVGLILGVTGERLLFARGERLLGGNLGTWAGSAAPTSGHAFIAAQPGGGRVVSIGEHANRALAARLQAVDGYGPMYPLRYHELFGALIAPELELDPARSAYYHGWGNRAYAFGAHLDMDVADLLGVRWLYVRGRTLPDPELTARFEDAGVTVYENPEAFPRTFVVHEATVVADRAAVVAAVGGASAQELRRRVYLAAADVPPDGPPLTEVPAGATDPAATATIETDGIDRIAIRARTATPGIVVLADTWTPDWVADVDGTPATVLPVDGALRGVVIPAGEHLVTLRYRPIATHVGIAVAIGTAVIGVTWLAWSGRRRPSVPRS